MDVVTVTDLGIRFKMARRRRSRTRDALVSWLGGLRNDHGGLRSLVAANQQGENEFWALRHVTLSVKQGETLGVIGRNGSGKSTLLRVIGGIYPPDEGKVSVRGQVSTLFSLGAGFQPELSGIDNIYLNGVLMGLSKKEIDAILDDIIDFAELGEFIDMPVKTYSSGMSSRLGFSIAMNVNKDIVLIDEIMGAGDAAFQEKAQERLNRIIGERTIVLVSHSMNTVRQSADHVVWLDKGQIAAQGEPKEVVQQYLEATSVQATRAQTSARPERGPS
jgi:ABC-type polysaccharide/polyol phosphate transport system ATPase subunit